MQMNLVKTTLCTPVFTRILGHLCMTADPRDTLRCASPYFANFLFNGYA